MHFLLFLIVNVMNLTHSESSMNGIIVYHIDEKLQIAQRKLKYISFFVINIMECMKHYITAGFPKLQIII